MTLVADALVIGAGVAGSSLACALARAGWSVVLTDKSRFPRHKACGEFLSPEAVAILRGFGLEETVRGLKPVLIRTARLHAERGVSLEIPLPEPALGISRHALDARLQRAAGEAGALVRTGCLVADIEDRNGHYRAALGPDREPIQARVVIGAWGRTPPPGIRPGERMRSNRAWIGIKAHFTGAAENSPAVDLYFFNGGYVGIADVEGGRLNVAALVPGPLPSAGLQAAGLERMLAQVAARVPQLRQRVAVARLMPGTFAGAYPVITSRKPRAWHDGMPLVGDAAAVIPPLCGDGMAMALRGAALCAPLADACLRGKISKAEWRHRYAQQLDQAFSAALRWGDRLNRWLLKPRTAGLLLKGGQYFPAAAAHLFQTTRIR